MSEVDFAMGRRPTWQTFAISVAISLLTLASASYGFPQDQAQMPAPAAATQMTGSSVPRLVAFSGVIKDGAGKPVTVPVYVTFALYAEQEGGMPLWSEAQMVQPDGQGHYSAFLGATEPTGLPLNLFATGAARWLAVQPGVPGLGDPSRVLLVGVPYALKAADADTLGGKPASAFLTADSQAGQGNASPGFGTQAAAAPALGVSAATAPSGSGTTDYLPIWTNSTTLGNSTIFEAGGKVGIGNTTPASTLDVTGGATVRGDFELPSLGTSSSSAGYLSQPLDLLASAYNSSTKAAVSQDFRWQAEPVANNTGAPSGKLDLLFASGGGTPAETGLSVSSKGLLTFAPGKSFPGSGSGTITGVTAGTDLTGGGTSGNVTLNLDTTKVPQLNASNAFTGSQSVTGNVNVTGTLTGANADFSGEGIFAGGLSAAANYSALQGSATADSDFNPGVWGRATGNTQQTIGVWGLTYSVYGAGVYGQIVGSSNTGSGFLHGGVWGDTDQGGSTAVLGTADDGVAGGFYNNSGNSPALWAINNYSSEFPALIAGGGGYCQIDTFGDLGCTGTKSAVVPVDNGSRKVALYAIEAPENWFEDAGSGQLSNGAATISLESIFAQTVNTGIDYHVLLTPEGDCKGLYVTNKTSQGFEVHELGGGRSNIAFAYRIMARRKGYESIRLADKTRLFEAAKPPRRNVSGTQKPAAARKSLAAAAPPR